MAIRVICRVNPAEWRSHSAIKYSVPESLKLERRLRPLLQAKRSAHSSEAYQHRHPYIRLRNFACTVLKIRALPAGRPDEVREFVGRVVGERSVGEAQRAADRDGGSRIGYGVVAVAQARQRSVSPWEALGNARNERRELIEMEIRDRRSGIVDEEVRGTGRRRHAYCSERRGDPDQAHL